MNFLQVKNWETFQHYKQRNPPWLKLHRALLDDYAFCSLPDSAKGHLMLLWLYASQNNGLVPVDIAFLERKISCVGIDLDLLIEGGFLVPQTGASNMLARG